MKSSPYERKMFQQDSCLQTSATQVTLHLTYSSEIKTTEFIIDVVAEIISLGFYILSASYDFFSSNELWYKYFLEKCNKSLEYLKYAALSFAFLRIPLAIILLFYTYETAEFKEALYHLANAIAWSISTLLTYDILPIQLPIIASAALSAGVFFVFDIGLAYYQLYKGLKKDAARRLTLTSLKVEVGRLPNDVINLSLTGFVIKATHLLEVRKISRVLDFILTVTLGIVLGAILLWPPSAAVAAGIYFGALAVYIIVLGVNRFFRHDQMKKYHTLEKDITLGLESHAALLSKAQSVSASAIVSSDKSELCVLASGFSIPDGHGSVILGKTMTEDNKIDLGITPVITSYSGTFFSKNSVDHREYLMSHGVPPLSTLVEQAEPYPR